MDETPKPKSQLTTSQQKYKKQSQKHPFTDSKNSKMRYLSNYRIRYLYYSKISHLTIPISGACNYEIWGLKTKKMGKKWNAKIETVRLEGELYEGNK